MTNMIQCATPKREYAYSDGPEKLESWDQERFEKAGVAPRRAGREEPEAADDDQEG